MFCNRPCHHQAVDFSARPFRIQIFWLTKDPLKTAYLDRLKGTLIQTIYIKAND